MTNTTSADISDKTLRLIGHVGVDSGQVLVTDPCYLDKWAADDFDPYKDRSSRDYSYSGACNATLSDIGGSEIGTGTQGVASRTAYGDGYYGVYQIVGEDGTVEGLLVDFSDLTNPDEIASEDDDEGY